jgi:nucleoid-associated protein YgaU
MAARFYGTSNKSNLDLIINANPALKQNPNVVIVGKTYIIPNAASSQAAATQQPAQSAPASTPRLTDNVVIVEEKPKAQPTNASIASTPEHLYTVKFGDTLRKIAVEQLGSVDAVSAILELNQDKIKNADAIQQNMKLRLPAKPISAVAQTN